MATNNTTKAQNVYQKLLKARAMFLNADPKKSGKNMQLAFKYFELDDIVPIAIKIFESVLNLLAYVVPILHKLKRIINALYISEAMSDGKGNRQT